MLSRRIVFPFAPELLVRRQYENWQRAIGIGYTKGTMKRSEGFKFPCWVCGEQGTLGVDGFGSKGTIRIRNMMHDSCYQELPIETRRVYAHRDRIHVIRRMERRKTRRALDRESKKEGLS